MQDVFKIRQYLEISKLHKERTLKQLKDHMNTDKPAVGYIIKLADDLRNNNTENNVLEWVLEEKE